MSDKPYFHIFKWNSTCWMLTLIWIAIGFLGNLPTVSQHPVTSTQYTIWVTEVGWPFTYFEGETSYPGPTINYRRFRPLVLIVDLFSIAATQIAIVFVIQKWMPRFSIRSMFVFTAIIASLIMAGKFVIDAESPDLFFGFLWTIYYSPISAWIFLTLAARLGWVRSPNRSEKLT